MEQKSETGNYAMMDVGSRASEYKPQEGEYRDGAIIVERTDSVDVYDFYFLDMSTADSGYLLINPSACITIDVPDAEDDIECIGAIHEEFPACPVTPNMKTISLTDVIGIHTTDYSLIRKYFKAEGKTMESFVATVFAYLMTQQDNEVQE